MSRPLKGFLRQILLRLVFAFYRTAVVLRDEGRSDLYTAALTKLSCYNSIIKGRADVERSKK